MKSRTTSRRLGLLFTIPKFYFRSILQNGFHPLKTGRAMAASLREGYRPDEAHRLGLLLPGANARTFPRFISKRKFARVQKRVNPLSWEALLSDKGMFYRFCEHASLPVPGLYAIFFQRTRGWVKGGRALLTREDWLRFMQHECPEEFVVKPAWGAYGSGVHILRRAGESLSELGGVVLTIRQLYASLQHDPEFDSFVFQERCRNHMDVLRLSPSEGLQTLRMMTNVAMDGTPELMYAFLRVIVGNSSTDNYRSGKSGTLLARVSVSDGRIESCWKYKPEGGIISVDIHPLTAIAFKGYGLPHWRETVDLVNRAAVRFLPIKTVGWDVALTGRGPVLIEGNIWCDPPTHSFEMDRIVKQILET